MATELVWPGLEEWERGPDPAKVPGIKAVLAHFEVLYSGWETDNSAWIVEMEDGERRIVTTGHCSPYFAERGEFDAKVVEYERVLADTRRALGMLEPDKWTPDKAGTVSASGDIFGADDRELVSGGSVWLRNSEEAERAEQHGWKRTGATTIAGLVQVERH